MKYYWIWAIACYSRVSVVTFGRASIASSLLLSVTSICRNRCGVYGCGRHLQSLHCAAVFFHSIARQLVRPHNISLRHDISTSLATINPHLIGNCIYFPISCRWQLSRKLWIDYPVTYSTARQLIECVLCGYGENPMHRSSIIESIQMQFRM